MSPVPSWWASGVRVVDSDGARGQIERIGGTWGVRIDPPDGGEAEYVINPEPSSWRPEVRALVTGHQRARVVWDAERALLRAFGCHYVPEFEALPESVRTGPPVHPKAVGRTDLDGLLNIVRGAVLAALTPYTRDNS